ncbi:HupE/UreJ family protein [Ponticaulis sp.]|uniref:HupE/UreJ family protein n=1 Tax=Ponticaulis sp. TaxID=2020902 RepID=UPI000B6596EC|nr:HupE/UreJ family protein [Ponticaulis sp.]MAI91359.1 hypothetical protein [Ponticaulis sp.]OUX97956.1 MAG: hypothetical protein CBB65_13025 [Hyphomonadaceae bacterium TMED5]|tara:strand:+ start:17575 stop:18312 length:738 start_codon:yes stop_codon:yes gene_type:complete
MTPEPVLSYRAIGAGPRQWLWVAVLAGIVLFALPAIAHDVSQQNARYIELISGFAPVPYLYLGAKHMVTGLDHILFLVGVVFFLRELRDVLIYVSLFTLGHSLTLLGGVLGGFHANEYLVDAIIGLSVVYKAYDNLGGFSGWGAFRIDPKYAVAAFGLAHGTGLATKLQALSVSDDGLIGNMLSFNVGVELGQILVLMLVVSILNIWRNTNGFEAQARLANTLLMAAGFILFGQHFTVFLIGGAA